MSIFLENIVKSYGSNIILNNITYSFDRNKIYGLIGRNGAGKTTLLKTICRLISDNTGNIIIDDQCVNKYDYFRIPLSYITDTPVYYQDLTIKEHLLTICYSQKIKRNEAVEKCSHIINEMKLQQYQDSFPATLSKGTIQRLNIAMGLLRNVDIFLMDEPFSSLDPVQVKIIERKISKMKNEKTIQLISSHDIDSLATICDIFLILKNGNLIECDPKIITKEEIAILIDDSYGE